MRFPPIPATVSLRDARYLSLHLYPVTRDLKKIFKYNHTFTIVDAADKLPCLKQLKYQTRNDIAGAIMRTLVSMNMLSRDGRKFVFKKDKKQYAKEKLSYQIRRARSR